MVVGSLGTFVMVGVGVVVVVHKCSWMVVEVEEEQLKLAEEGDMLGTDFVLLAHLATV